MEWRARVGARVISTAPQRHLLVSTRLVDALATDVVTIDVKPASGLQWYHYESIERDGTSVIQQRLLPYPVDPVPAEQVGLDYVPPKRKRRKFDWTEPQRERRRQSQKRARIRAAGGQVSKAGPYFPPLPADGHPKPISRGQIARLRELDDEPTPTASPAGLAQESYAWVLRGLYQEQYERLMEFHTGEGGPESLAHTGLRPDTYGSYFRTIWDYQVATRNAHAVQARHWNRRGRPKK